MNKEFLEGLGIDASQGLENVLEQLEQKQMEILSRLDNVHDEERRNTLEKSVEQIDAEIKEVKDEIKVMKSALVLDEEPEEGAAETATAVEEQKEAPKKKSGRKSKSKDTDKKESEAKSDAVSPADEMEAKANAVKEKAAKKKSEAEEEKRYNEEKEVELADNANAANGTSTSSNNAQNAAQAPTQTGTATTQTGTATAQTGTATAAAAQTGTVTANSTPAAGNTASSVPASAQNNTSAEFATALHEYKVKHYDKAFPLLKKLAEEGDITSQYIIAQMYKEGQGTTKDNDRWEYWISKSANGGEASAQFDYGKYLVANADKDSKNLSKGLDYLEMAGKQDDLDAVRSYYEIVLMDHGNRANVKKALGFCQKLIDTATDSYDKEQLANGYKTLKEKYKSKGKKVKNTIAQNTISVAGATMMLLALAYVFCGIQTELRMSNEYLAKLPYIEDGFLLPIDAFWDRCAQYLSYEGMLGLQLLAVAQLLKSIGNGYYKVVPVNLYCGLTDIAAFGLMVWHAVELTNIDVPVETNMPAYLVMCFIAMLPGMLVGNTVKRALQWD